MLEPVRWIPGDVVVERGIWRGKLWWACPSRVVQDTPELLAVYWPAGTPTRSPSPYPTPQDQLYNRIQLEDRNWTDTDVLMLTTPGAAHSVYVMWEAGQRKQRCWYINLQEPIRRTPIGFDTMDQILDVVVSPDRSRWRWKDEAEFKQAEAIGVYTYAEARAIEAEGSG